MAHETAFGAEEPVCKSGHSSVGEHGELPVELRNHFSVADLADCRLEGLDLQHLVCCLFVLWHNTVDSAHCRHMLIRRSAYDSHGLHCSFL